MQSENLKIICLNCQSIIGKKVFWELLDNGSTDIVVACETWLDKTVANNEIIPPDYKLYHRDRDDGYGGIFIAVKNKISSQLVQCSVSCEMCAVKLHLTDGQALIIIGAYRPPNRDTLCAQNLFDTITDISTETQIHLLLCRRF